MKTKRIHYAAVITIGWLAGAILLFGGCEKIKGKAEKAVEESKKRS